MKKIMILIIISVCFTGCSGFKSMPKDINMPSSNLNDKPSNVLYASLPPEEGSLWTPTGNMLFVDKKAKQVGDVIIVSIVENATSSLNASTSATGSSSLTAGIPNMPYYQEMTNLMAANPTKASGSKNVFDTTTESKFKGQGSSDRNGKVTASIGARVTEVLPNGNLVIFGKRAVKVNYETQNITVSGIVRPKDITQDNTIQSTYITDAVIEYSGKGVLAEKQKPGWLIRLLSYVWPF